VGGCQVLEASSQFSVLSLFATCGRNRGRFSGVLRWEVNIDDGGQECPSHMRSRNNRFLTGLSARFGMTRIRLGCLLQLRVLGLRFFQDGDVGVGVFPEGEEIFVGGEGSDAGGVGIRSLCGSRLQGIGASHAQMR
jgi:hypothetical protein